MSNSIKVYLKDFSPRAYLVCSDPELTMRIGRIVKPFAYPLPPYINHLFRASLDFDDVRDKFRYHETLDDAVTAILNKLNGKEELPDDTEVIYNGVKLWDYEEVWRASSAKYIGTDEQYLQFYRPFRNKNSYCLGGCISHGCDVAGYTEAAIYLTSLNQTQQGFVIRYSFADEKGSRVKLEDAPKGLFIRT